MYFKDVIFTCKLRYPFEDDVALHFLNFESTLPKDIFENPSLHSCFFAFSYWIGHAPWFVTFGSEEEFEKN